MPSSEKNPDLRTSQQNDINQRNDGYSEKAGSFLQLVSDRLPQLDQDGRPITAMNLYVGLGISPETIIKANKGVAEQIGSRKGSDIHKEILSHVDDTPMTPFG